MTTNIREFKGYKVSEDFVIEVKSRGEDAISLNLQELMAARLAGHPWTTSDKSFQGTTGMEELGVTTNPYGKMKSMRTSDKWNPAKEHFAGLNNLSEDKVKLLSGFTSQSSNGSSSANTPKKLTKGDTGLLGLMIASELDKSGLQDFVVNTGLRGSVVRHAITNFISSVQRDLRDHTEHAKYEKEVKSLRELREQGKVLDSQAREDLALLGITEPSKEQVLNMVSIIVKRNA